MPELHTEFQRTCWERKKKVNGLLLLSIRVGLWRGTEAQGGHSPMQEGLAASKPLQVLVQGG